MYKRQTVYSDKKWIAFILNQLIQNSVKYGRSEGTHIQIVTKKTKSGVLLRVKDDGIGIPKEEIPRIFEKGFTGTNGRNRERSTGMGLYPVSYTHLLLNIRVFCGIIQAFRT